MDSNPISISYSHGASQWFKDSSKIVQLRQQLCIALHQYFRQGPAGTAGTGTSNGPSPSFEWYMVDDMIMNKLNG